MNESFFQRTYGFYGKHISRQPYQPLEAMFILATQCLVLDADREMYMFMYLRGVSRNIHPPSGAEPELEVAPNFTLC